MRVTRGSDPVGLRPHPNRAARLYLLSEASILNFDARAKSRAEGGPEMKDRLPTTRLRLLAMVVVVAAVAGVAASAQAAPGAAARLSVRSTEDGKALFGPSGKVVYVFGAHRGSTSPCYGARAPAWAPL